MTSHEQTLSTSASPRPLPPEFQALSDLVRQARQGELRIADTLALHGQAAAAGAHADETALPSGLYRDAPAPARAWPAEIRAGLWGVAAGLVLLVPLVIFLREPAAPRPLTPVTALPLTSEWRPAATVPVASATVDPLQILTDIETAERLLRTGDVLGARTALATATAANSPRALFLMAETHDPNALAGWGTRGVTADAARARALYAAANAFGHPLAEPRLKALE
jgi:hypothetical protein